VLLITAYNGLAQGRTNQLDGARRIKVSCHFFSSGPAELAHFVRLTEERQQSIGKGRRILLGHEEAMHAMLHTFWDA
jgi:hypothetical protein